MNEARLRIKTLNANQTIFSTQDIVECAEYAQGCDGGFPYLISGKYAEVKNNLKSDIFSRIKTFHIFSVGFRTC